jgi:membrane-associated protein
VEWVQVLIAGLLAFGEAALGLGVIFPGEVAIVALATSLDSTSTLAAMLAVALGAILGDHVGYLLGRRFGPKLSESSVIRRVGVDKWETASALMRRYGLLALLVSRLLPFVRTVMPAVAGAARLRYARFLTASALGSSLWAVLWVGAGGVLDEADLFDSPAGLAGVLMVAIVLLLASRWVIGRLHALSASERADPTTYADEANPGTTPAQAN